MGVAGRLALALVGLVLGGGVGGIAGLPGGLLYTDLASSVNFEGYSG